MLKNFTQSISINGVSAITTDMGEEKVIAYMNANITTAGGISFSQSTKNTEEYLANKEIVDADFSEFQQKVAAIAKGFRNNSEE